MKKLLALVAGLAAAGSAFAAPVGNPAAPMQYTDGVFFCDDCSCWSLRAGYRGDFVFDRKLESGRTGFGSGTIDTYSLYTNAGVLTLNLWDRLDIYGVWGATSQDLSTKLQDTAGTASYDEINFETKSIWAVGAKAVLWCWNWGCNCGTTTLGADANYESVSSANAQTWVKNGAVSTHATRTTAATRYKEWQVSLGLAHRVALLTPYVAVKWSSAHANAGGRFNATSELPGLKSQRHWGWALGTTLVDAGRMTVSGEARFVDEKAATVTAEFRF